MIVINDVQLKEALQGLRELPAGCIDLIVTDPPYYIEALQKNMRAQTLRRSSKNNIFYSEFDQFDNMSHYYRFIAAVLLEMHRVLKPKGQVYMFFSYHHVFWCKKMVKDYGFRYYKELLWYKRDTMGVFPNQYGCNYENIMWFRKDGDGGTVKLRIGNGQKDVFDVPSTNIRSRKEAGFHPTPKPTRIVRQLIRNGSDKGDIILDPFMGSGTTAVAAKNTSRNFIGFEYNNKYVAICNKRLMQDDLQDFFEVRT